MLTITWIIFVFAVTFWVKLFSYVLDKHNIIPDATRFFGAAAMIIVGLFFKAIDKVVDYAAGFFGSLKK